MRLGVILRAHVRHKTLDIALSELERYEDELGIEVKTQLVVDRPHFLVNKVLDKHRDRLFGLRYVEPLLQAGRARWMENANDALDRLEPCAPDWVLFADDDRWFEPSKINAELHGALHQDNVDVWKAESLFFWDKPTQINVGRHHWAPVLWRHVTGCRFPTDRVIQTPIEIHDEAVVSGRVSTLRTPLLDYGSFSAEERQRVHDAHVRSGGYDAADPWVASLLAPPDLRKYEPKPDLWSEYPDA